MRFDIHVHIHNQEDSAILRDILHTVDMILSKVNNMPTKQDFDALIAAFNTATNKIAARIQALEDKLTDAGLSAEDEAAVLNELGTLKTQLEALGADPTDPVPPIDPTPSPSQPPV